MAKSAEGRYPADEAHWLIATAHNAGVSAKGRREMQLATEFMRLALDLSTKTGCKGVAMDSCRKALDTWGADVTQAVGTQAED